MSTNEWAPIPVTMPRPGLAIRGRRLAQTAALLGRHLAPAAGRVVFRRQPRQVAISQGARRAC
ncbi:MAG TPA: hypothetical protein PKI89_08105, partial [Tepidiformaceae bacterium]|nr:hypothetical protein [Tepidiformaceae bacterium]